jgi:heme-degrading monooxygenase HmoA
MTTIGMHYDVLPGKGPAFVEGFLGVLALMKTLPGHIDSHLYEDVQTPGSYVIMSEWDSKEAFGKFIQSREFADTVTWGKAEILRSRPRHKIYTNG